MPTISRLFFIFLSTFFASGCSPPGQPITEASPAEQIAAIRSGKTDMILLESTPVQDAALLSLTGIPGLRILQLDHPDNKVTDAGMADVARLTPLEHLRIRGGYIGDEGLKAICEMPNLKILNLPQGKFTDAGLAHLKKLPKLESLRIGSPRVTDKGVAELRDYPRLLRIHLIDIPITDRGLADLQSISQLESLYLDGANVSDAAVDELFRKRPKLHVHFNQAHHDRDPNQHEH